MMWQKFLFLTLILTSNYVVAQAQWKIVAPHALHCFTPWESGAIHCKDSIVWAADTDLVFSLDLGVTWKRVLLPKFASSVVNDISFLSRDTGVLGTIYGFIFQTFDGGNTWKQVFSIWNQTFNFGWLGRIIYQDSEHIYGMLEQDGVVVSTNGGKSWVVRPLPIPNGDHLCLAANNGVLYSEAGDLSIPYGRKNGNVLSSSDLGVTWQTISSMLDGDCYSIDIDPGDSTKLYLLDENFALPGDSSSKVLIGNTITNTWNVAFSHSRRYLSGGMTLSRHAIYIPTVSEGILRSIDQGTTWKNIGGPNAAGDSRSICAVNDNILFAFDTLGNIWATYNSGGDSVLGRENFLSITPSIIFEGDTLVCNNLSDIIRFYKHGTSPPAITGWSIIGPNAANYSASNFSQDSIEVSLLAKSHGQQNASIVFQIGDGSHDTVHLAGFVSASLNPLALATSDEKTDTLGGEVSVPISIEGLMKTEDIQCVLFYDTTLNYLGTFDASGTKVDIPGEQWPGGSRLHIANVTSSSVAAEVRFNVFAGSIGKLSVRFDSVQVLTATSPCEYLMPSATIAAITPPQECGSTILSKFMQGQPWNFSIRPNPTTENVLLESSVNIDGASIEVFDALGIKRRCETASFAAQSPVQLSLPSNQGMYYVRIKSQYGVFSTRVILMR